MLSKGRINNILGTASSMKLRITRLIVGDVELTKREYLNASATTTAAAVFIITATSNIATKAKGVTVKILGNVLIVLN